MCVYRVTYFKVYVCLNGVRHSFFLERMQENADTVQMLQVHIPEASQANEATARQRNQARRRRYSMALHDIAAPLLKFHDMQAWFALHADKHAAELLSVTAAPRAVPVRVMSGSIAVGRFIMKLTSDVSQEAGVESESVNAACCTTNKDTRENSFQETSPQENNSCVKRNQQVFVVTRNSTTRVKSVAYASHCKRVGYSPWGVPRPPCR